MTVLLCFSNKSDASINIKTDTIDIEDHGDAFGNINYYSTFSKGTIISVVSLDGDTPLVSKDDKSNSYGIRLLSAYYSNGDITVSIGKTSGTVIISYIPTKLI